MVALALEAVTSFSVVPLRLITLIGFLVFVGTTIVSLWALWVRLFSNSAVPGWTSIVLPVYFLGGIQIFCIGMLGEYLGKAYAEVKARPRYLIEKTVSAHTNKALPVAKVKSEVEISETVVYPR
jgi:glycosyltransferase involved in cell wall biosynthesis